MHPAIAILILLAVLAAFVWQGSSSRNQETILSNLFEGVHDTSKTYALDADVTTRFLLAKIGSDDGHVAVAGAADIPIGVINDEGSAGDFIAVGLLGKSPTKRVVASEIIAAGEEVFAAANGKVQNRPSGAGTYYFIGIALSTSVGDGDVMEVNDGVPQKLVIAGA